MTESPTSQIPGVYHRRIGDIVVTAISDGYLDGGVDVLRNITVEESAALMHTAFRSVPRRTSLNCFAVRVGGRCALIETGSGDYMGPTAGWTRRNLAAAGIDRADIEAVLLTHMHPDHSAGLADRTTGARFFPNAELVMHEKEAPHWHDDAIMARASDREKKLYFQCARDQFAPYRDRLRTFSTGTEVFPGITAMPILGHTPGHTAYVIHSGDEQLLIWGDTVHVPEVQIPRPEVCIAFDTDPAAAAASRKKLFDMVATDRLLVAGMHLHFPAFSHLVRTGAGYALVPEPWAFEV
jgi:glyoxylase-like metal-dependent hydrolase (beta-lactamase superfamily II)